MLAKKPAEEHDMTGSGEDPLDAYVGRMRDGDRLAAAEFFEQYGPLVRRRVRGKLSAAMRRLVDSQELLSTVARRLDGYIQTGRMAAETPQQLWALVFRIADAAIVDKVRVLKRLERVEGEDSYFANELRGRLSTIGPRSDEGFAEELDLALRSLEDSVDREILAMWLAGTQHRVIAELLGMSAPAVRQRWHSIKERLRAWFEARSQ